MFPYLIVKNLVSKAIHNTIKFLKRDYLEVRFIRNVDKINSFYEKSISKNIENVQKDLFTYTNKYGLICNNRVLIESKEKLYWNVDIIDCFENFVNNIHYWGTCISLVDKTKAAQVRSVSYYLPFLDEFFYCAENQGCYLNNKKLNILNSSKNLISSGTNTFLERNIGSKILSIMYCAADRINVAKIMVDDSLEGLAKLVMKEVKGNIIVSRKNTIIIGNESAVNISYKQ